MFWEHSRALEQQAEQSVPLLFQALQRAKPWAAQPQAQLAEDGGRLKSPLLISKRVSAYWGQLSFPSAVDVGLLPWLRQFSPPVRFRLRTVVHAYARIEQTRNICDI